MLTAVLNSHLAAWFYFVTTSVCASERDAVRQKEYLTLPFPSTEDIAESKAMQNAQSKLVELVDRAQRELEESKHEYLVADASTEYFVRLLKEVDAAVYDFYGLSDVERVIIDDFFDYIMPASQPRPSSPLTLRDPCGKAERLNYASTLQSALGKWFPKASISITSPARSKDLVVLRLQLHPIDLAHEYHEEEGNLFGELDRLWEALPEDVGYNFQLIPDVRLFLDNSLYMVKPTSRRYWLKSSALEDADGIVADLHQAMILEREGRFE